MSVYKTKREVCPRVTLDTQVEFLEEPGSVFAVITSTVQFGDAPPNVQEICIQDRIQALEIVNTLINQLK